MLVEDRVTKLEMENAVMEERTKNLGSHVESIAHSVELMQKWIMGFIISCALIVTGSMVKSHMSGSVVTASPTKYKIELSADNIIERSLVEEIVKDGK